MHQAEVCVYIMYNKTYKYLLFQMSSDFSYLLVKHKKVCAG